MIKNEIKINEHINYFQKEQKEQKQHKQRKIVILGFRGVGKTSITTRFISGFFEKKYQPTIENSYKKTIEFFGNEYLVEIVDTPGQDESTILPFAYNIGTDAFVFVYTISSKTSFKIMKSLKDKVTENYGNILKIIVGNQCDRKNQREVSFEEGIALAREWECQFLECSAKEDYNTMKVFLSILQEVEKKMNPIIKKRKECTIL
ncbi:gtp-binding protein rheb [Anaeramoeba ignava]|uniref:Gtp-binding protein rheb n=1 Tax=Anaeramoeba ignava TaxID=1746090 RepID=A0A9Q0LLN9_ANAIG|nr:gtp-binding protein rheb [Anaeramoeba ignava]